LIHELGHALLHGEELPKSQEVAEVEVESVAYIVCDALGLDSGEYSFPYVTGWAEGSTDVVKETAGRTIGCAKHILEGLEVALPPPGWTHRKGPALGRMREGRIRPVPCNPSNP
jgi:hypothetical protein